MRVLVTGADGFVGHHLVAHLTSLGDEVHQAVGPGGERGHLRYALDVRDRHTVRDVVHAASPEAIFHLAAVAYGPDARADLATALETTVVGTARVLEAAAELPRPPAVLVTGSSEVYGAPAHERISEDAPTRPVNLYGATKLSQEIVAVALSRAHGLHVIVTRSFNHIGPGQRDVFAVASFARQLAEVRADRAAPVVRTGNLDAIRDFTDVRDVVRAYRSLVSVEPGATVVNVASGVGTRIGALLDRLIAISGLDVTLEADPSRARADDPKRIVGDPSLVRRMTGWEPAIPLDRTLRDVWDDAVHRWP